MQNEQEEEIARRWRLEEEESTRMNSVREREGWRRVEEVMEELAPKRRRITAPPTAEREIVDLINTGREERNAVTARRKRKGRG